MNAATMNLAASTMPARPASRGVSNALFGRPRTLLWMLLLPPLAWFLLFYLGPLLALLGQSVLTFDDFSMTVSNELTLANFKALVSDPSNLDIVARTFTMALAVSAACALLGYPIAYYMARYADARMKGLLYVAVMLPMWASYIVKAYAWTVILAKEGLVAWLVSTLGLLPLGDALLALPYVGGNTWSTSHFGRFLVFNYMWLPFMILPIQASIERIAPNLLLASADLGASPAQTFRTVVLPLSVPGIAAGSIFTFCLTFGDFIIPTLVGPSGDFLGTAVYKYQGAIGNMPMAAALTLVPIVVVGAWLWLAKRLGAFDAL
ncbi:ABC transporter permease [Niveibacterium umoris]|uniref:Putative spermidine/putrescine transport system permease protein n=1 Tax=Niveibacterium umoris TaxID=1193620 RepID=A0A840BKF3_9RHOO|nr:ABC transporter permease [Niveibacterium umoris]MBB4013103.1 putative spermidine/putrescine transport system permease protein [Niveibacterium umoris]